jgi:hypothetical protein
MSQQGGAPDPRRTTRRYSRIVGLAFIAFIVFVGFQVIDNGGGGGTGLSQGSRAPEFAAPSAAGTLEGDANICESKDQRGCESVPLACDVTEKDAIRICDYFDRPLVMVVWFSRCNNCPRQLDTVERVRKRFPNVAFVGVDVRDDHDKVRKLVVEHGWGFPMALDRDGAVSQLYNVGVGPTTFFIYPKGSVMHTALGELNEQLLVRNVRRLVRASREQRPGRRS